MTRLLLVEDQASDLRTAAEVARTLGFEAIEARNDPQGAVKLLEQGFAGQAPLPNAIVLDLDLGYESGHEFLRYWHSTPAAHKIPLIVWSVLGEEQREICNLFKVSHYVSKWEGAEALKAALSSLTTATGEAD